MYLFAPYETPPILEQGRFRLGLFAPCGGGSDVLKILKSADAVCLFLRKGYLAVTDFRLGAFLPERRNGCTFAAEKQTTINTIQQ